MKKTRIVLSALLCSSFGWASCDFKEMLVQIGIGDKKVVDDDENKGQGSDSGSEGQGGDSGSGSGEQGGGSGGESQGVVTLELLKDLIRPISANIFDTGVSQVEIVEYDPELYDEVTYYYEFDGVMFVGIYNVPDYKDDEDVIENYLIPLKNQVPTDAVLVDELSESDVEYGYYFLVYKIDTLYYVVYAEDYVIFPIYSLDIVPIEDYEKYLDIAFPEDEEDFLDTDLEDPLL